MKTFLEFLSDISENLVLKRRPTEDGKFQFIVDSDIADKRLAGNETYKNKDKIKKLGFEWDRNLGKWVSPAYDQVEFSAKLPELRRQVLSLNADFDEKTFAQLTDELEDYLELGIKDKIKETFDDLKRRIVERQNSPEIREFLRFSAKFTNRSFNNQIFIWIQNKNATHVEGMRTWREKFGRKIKKGAKAIKIWVPITGRKKASSTEEDVPQVDEPTDMTRNITRFTTGNVFDIADTEPIEGKEHMYVQEPKWYDDTTPDETTRYIYDALLQFAKDKNIEVTVSAEGLGQARGVSKKGSIQLMQENIPTMIHELAHELLHTMEKRKDKSRSELETEAEGVNFLVSNHYGLPYEQSERYIAMWTEPERAKQNLDKFFEKIRNNPEITATAEMLIKYIDEKTMESISEEPNALSPNQQESTKNSWFF